MESTGTQGSGARHGWLSGWIFRVGLVALLLAAPAQALAAEDLLKSGIEAYGLADFKGSRRTLEKAAASTTDTAMLARIHFYIGCNEVALKRMKQARGSFRRAVKLAPAMAPEPGEHKPAVIEAFRLVRASMVGLLRLSVGPGQAEVLLDNRRLSGALSTPRALSAGVHSVEVRRDGVAPYKKKVEIEAWAEPTEQQRLRILEGELRQTSLDIPRVRKPAPRPAAISPPPPAPSGRRTRTILGYTAVALAGAAAAGAGVLYGLGISRGDEAHALYKETSVPGVAAMHREDVEAAQELVIGGHVSPGSPPPPWAWPSTRWSPARLKGPNRAARWRPAPA